MFCALTSGLYYIILVFFFGHNKQQPLMYGQTGLLDGYVNGRKSLFDYSLSEAAVSNVRDIPRVVVLACDESRNHPAQVSS